MTVLIIILLFILRIYLLYFSKYINIKLLCYPKIALTFKLGGIITIVYIYFLLYSLFFLDVINLFSLKVIYIFFLQNIFFVIGFNILLYYWYIFDCFGAWMQKIILSRQIYFALVAFISFLIFKSGLVIENYNLAIELENMFKLISEKEPNYFDFSTSIENSFSLGIQYLWLFLFINFISFFCNPGILLSEKILCVLFGPYFPGIGFFTKEIGLGVKEIEGIRLITKNKPIVSRPQTQIIPIIKEMNVRPIKTNVDLFNKLLFNMTRKEEDIENYNFITWLSKVGNLVIPDKESPNQLVPTKHFYPFKDHLSIEGNLVKTFNSFPLAQEYQLFLEEQKRISQLRYALTETGLSSYYLKVYQMISRGNVLNLSEEQFREINCNLSTISLHDLFQDLEENKSTLMQNVEASLSDGSHRNPFHAHTHKMLRLQFISASYVAQELKLQLFPYLEEGQGDYLTNLPQTLLEQKVEKSVFTVEDAKEKINKVFLLERTLINSSRIDEEVTEKKIIYSFAFPFLQQDFSAVILHDLSADVKKYGIDPNSIVITNFKKTNDS